MADDISNSDGYYRNAAVVRRSSLERGGTLLIPQRPANASTTKVPFQQVMDNMRGTAPTDNLGSPVPRQVENGQEQHQPITQITSHDERGTFRDEMQKRNRRVESEPEQKKSKSTSTDGERPRAKTAEEKVVSRSPLSERQRDGQGQGKGGKGKDNSSRQGQGYTAPGVILSAQLKSLHKGKLQELGQGPFLQNLKGAQLKVATQPKATVFNKTLLDQIVHYVRLLTKPDGAKEMDIALHEKIFKGLRLKVSLVGDKTDATFMTQSEEVRDLFLSHRRDIEQALQEKGIEVREINVIMI